MLSLQELNDLEIKQRNARCGLCANNCQLNLYNFSGNRFISGNRCDRPLKSKTSGKYFNMFDFKYERLFDYAPLTEEEAIRGKIGIPRILNMYEHYPFWFTLFNELKFQVLISPRSNKQIYEEGMQTIPSESLCYPAKLANGHIQNLIDQGIKTIFYPSVLFENKDENLGKKIKNDAKFACPVITSYPEVIHSNMDSIKENKVNFMHPFVSFTDEKTMYENLKYLESEYAISKSELQNAVNKAFIELNKYQSDLDKKTNEILDHMEENKEQAIVVSGRPYHLDPEINHGIANLVTAQEMHVFTEDVIARLNDEELNLRVVDQWKYHSRLYQAANVVGKRSNLELIQLNSFGCGIDSVTSDQVKEIIEHYRKVYTGIKIDEGENLGAAKIRVRSLKATLNNRQKQEEVNEKYDYEPVALDGDLKDYTILAPQMSPFHFEFIESAARSEGFDMRILPEVDRNAINYGVKYVHNDSCYPALVVIGQMIKALEEYDLDKEKVALVISQTGGGCRATNYIALLRKALVEANMPNVPVIALNSGNVDDVNTFPISAKFALKAAIGILYGDALLRAVHRMRPYETIKGSTDELHDKWRKIIKEDVDSGSYFKFRKNIKKLIEEFDAIEIDENLVKPKVGVVGEILVKYHPTANNQLVDLLERNGAEVIIPDFLDFFLYGLEARRYVAKDLMKNNREALMHEFTLQGLEKYRNVLKAAIKKSKHFSPIHNIKHTAKNAEQLLSLANQTGEGWFLTGEIMNLLEDGVDNVVCTQPFGCLPNHIMGKGMFKPLRERYENANIIAIDYDPGASEVNQESRIILMLSVAKKNLQN